MMPDACLNLSSHSMQLNSVELPRFVGPQIVVSVGHIV